MALISVAAFYDGTSIELLEAPPSRKPYRVLVTFVELADASDMRERKPIRFKASFGAWRDDRPLEATLADIHERRQSKCAHRNM